MKARLIFLLSIKIVIISIFFACSSSPKETEKTSSLCYRSAFYVADDGWVYEFDNQYRSDVPMKDSGIEWIGMIPEHWGVAKLANLFTSLGGYAFNSDLSAAYTRSWRYTFHQKEGDPSMNEDRLIIYTLGRFRSSVPSLSFLKRISIKNSLLIPRLHLIVLSQFFKYLAHSHFLG